MEGLIEQGSREWHAVRLGKFTGSELNKLMTEPRNKNSDVGSTRHGYILGKLGEILTGHAAEEITGKALEWGKEWEPVARKWYERYRNIQVDPCSFIEHPSINYFGSSPDGKIEDDGRKGVLEIKCPYVTENHIKNLLIKDRQYFKENFPGHYWQTVSEMVCAGASFVDFISFDPRINDAQFGFEREGLGLFIIRMDLDQDDAKKLIDTCIVSRVRMLQIAKELNVTI